jgi:microcystin-dependent protein
LPIAENDVLFTLIGTTYGGDGQTTFALPDLRGRIPIHQTTTHLIGQGAGEEAVTLTADQTAHTHLLYASSEMGSPLEGPAGNLLARTTDIVYSPGPPGTGDATLSVSAVSTAGGVAAPHNNLAPFQCVNFIISLFGVYPSQV